MDSSVIHTIMVWAGIGFVFFALTMLAVFDVARKEFDTENARIKWWIIAIIPFIGWLIYFAAGFRKGKAVRDDGL